MTDASTVGVHRRITKQGEASTIGAGTATIASISLATNDDRMTVQGTITAYALTVLP